MLVDKLLLRGHSIELTSAFAHLLTDTSHQSVQDGQQYFTNVGVPQGAVTSPELFCIYIDDLVRKIHAVTTNDTHSAAISSAGDLRTFAFADDISCVGNEETIRKTIIVISEWCTVNGIELNKDKSMILPFKTTSGRGGQPKNQISGIKCCSEIKYLGVLLDSDMSFKRESKLILSTIQK